MSVQKSLLSFFSSTPKPNKTEDSNSAEITPIRAQAKTPRLEKSCERSNGSSNVKQNNGKDVFTSTPKRKKQDSFNIETKRTKTSVSNSRKSTEILDDDYEMDLDSSDVTTERSKGKPTKSRKRIQILDDDDEEVMPLQVSNGQSSSIFANSSQDSLDVYSRNDTSVQDMDTTTTSIVVDLPPQETEFEHTKLPFLKPDNIRDSNLRTPDHEDYDSTTLHVPKEYLDKQTPALRIWWKFKSQNFDKILLFKLGKFYELYHTDAILAVDVLHLSLMKCSDSKRFAHCGFPEFSFGRFSNMLVQRGYKVARIEQTETPEMLKRRMEKTKGKPRSEGKEETIVRRELCRVITPGTKTYGCFDGTDGLTSSKFLYAISETFDGSSRRYGLCFADCTVGKIWISEFDDDFYCSRLRTLFAQHPPAEILYPRRRISQQTEDILSGFGNSCKLEALAWKSQFLTSSEALKRITTNGYFITDQETGDAVGTACWPNVLRDTLDEGDILGSKCKKECELSVSSLGAIVWYLEKCLIDFDILPLKLFEKYEPPSNVKVDDKSSVETPDIFSKTMILDAAALKNVDVVLSSSKPNSKEGTLLELLDTCSTAFGKRLLRYWLCNPLCKVDLVRERQEAIGSLLKENDFMERATALLKQLPDLERLLQKVHAMGTKKRQNHPDSRAVLFEATRYNKRKVDDFLSTLEGLKKLMEVADMFKEISGRTKSSLLNRCLKCSIEEGGRFPDLRTLLADIESKFNRKLAKDDGVLVLNADIAEVKELIEQCKQDFDSYLAQERKKCGCPTIRYADCKGRNRYLLEVPDAAASRMPDDYRFSGQIKGYRRYTTDDLQELLEALKVAEEKRDAVYGDSMRRVFELFSESGEKWRRAIDCAATVDVLLALARYAKNCEHAVCVPTVTIAGRNQKPFIQIINGYHPCSAKIFTTAGQFMPNDTAIGKEASILLLTGPNMGGKSTLMRQVASLLILAQIGSYVPAEMCSFSLIDRVFTRLGASDRICSNQSTFAVELTETNMILRHATPHSLVIIDELGRGTATHDGAAIAYAVLKYLAENNGPRTLFSTHYHSLVSRFQNHSNIALGHMACLVENEIEDDTSEGTITFLYKLAPGACPKSHGFHAAKLAGIPSQIVKMACTKAKEIESIPVTAQRLLNLAPVANTTKDEELVAAVRKILINE